MMVLGLFQMVVREWKQNLQVPELLVVSCSLAFFFVAYFLAVFLVAHFLAFFFVAQSLSLCSLVEFLEEL